MQFSAKENGMDGVALGLLALLLGLPRLFGHLRLRERLGRSRTSAEMLISGTFESMGREVFSSGYPTQPQFSRRLVNW